MTPQTCSTRIPGSCAKERGSFLNISASSTWETLGAFEIANYPGQFLGYSGGATYGLDTLTLGWPGSGGPKLNDQIIGGSGSGDYFTGIFGLSPDPNNFTDVNNPRPSLLGSLKSQNTIPSHSYAYTAGAFYHERKPLAELTLGGYDSNQFVSHNTSFPFSTDVSRRLLLNIRSITSSKDDKQLLPTTAFAFIDSTDPNIWLPLDACKKFEEAFNLIWNEPLQMYFFETSPNTTVKREEKTSITFTLSENSTSSSLVSLEFPFTAFELLASPPLTRNGTTQRYFPLKRGRNDTQYVLGRAFLQETYLVVDHERSNFSIFQAAFPAPGTKQNLVPILPNLQETIKAKSGLSKGAIAGISIAILFVAVSCVGALLWALRRRKQRRLRDVHTEAFMKPELDGGEVKFSGHEADGRELNSFHGQYSELGESKGPAVKYEMEAEVILPEMGAENKSVSDSK